MTNPIDMRDARWRNLVEAKGAGEPLSADDEAFLAAHDSGDPEIRAERDLVHALGRLGEPRADRGDDDALVAATLQRWDEDGPARTTTAPPRRRRWMAVAGLLAASIAAFWLWPLESAREPPPDGERIVQTTPSAEPATANDSVETTATPKEPPHVVPVAMAPLVVASGTLVDDDGHVVPVAAALDAGTMRADGEACVRAGGSEACFAAGTELHVRRDEDATAIELRSGEADIRIAPMVTTVVFQVAGQRIEPVAPSVFVIEVGSASRWSMTVEEGELRVVGADGDATVISAGQTRAFGSRKAAPESASTLLERARKRRGAGDLAGAIEAYEELVAAHPTAPAARTAMVTLGQLHLDRGKPKKSLAWFDRYLQGKGPLTEDAQYGRIRALSALGRDREATSAIEAFLAKYPSGSYAAKLRDR